MEPCPIVKLVRDSANIAPPCSWALLPVKLHANNWALAYPSMYKAPPSTEFPPVKLQFKKVPLDPATSYINVPCV